MLERQVEHLLAQVDRQRELAGIVTSLEEFCQRVSSGLNEATFAQKRQLVELLIDRVVVTKEEVEICYVFPTNSTSEHTRFGHLCTDYLQNGLWTRRALEVFWWLVADGEDALDDSGI